MVELLVTLLIGLIVLGVIWYIIQLLPLPEPFGRIAQIVVVAIALIWLIYVLAGLVGGAGVPRLR
jgi:hypothetical protein